MHKLPNYVKGQFALFFSKNEILLMKKYVFQFCFSIINKSISSRPIQYSCHRVILSVRMKRNGKIKMHNSACLLLDCQLNPHEIIVRMSRKNHGSKWPNTEPSERTIHFPTKSVYQWSVICTYPMIAMNMVQHKHHKLTLKYIFKISL